MRLAAPWADQAANLLLDRIFSVLLRARGLHGFGVLLLVVLMVELVTAMAAFDDDTADYGRSVVHSSNTPRFTTRLHDRRQWWSGTVLHRNTQPIIQHKHGHRHERVRGHANHRTESTGVWLIQQQQQQASVLDGRMFCLERAD